jgi:hypothetical protein
LHRGYVLQPIKRVAGSLAPDFVAGLTVTHSDSANTVPHSIWVGWQVEQVSISNPHDLGFLVGCAEKCSVLSAHTFQKHFGGRVDFAACGHRMHQRLCTLMANTAIAPPHSNAPTFTSTR